jgi:hypothetical protein
MRELWQLGNVELLSSGYAVAEAHRNLAEANPECLPVLEELIRDLTLVAGTGTPLSTSVNLAEKDMPILSDAVESRATHLLTGDKRHFGRLFGTTVGGVLILPPGEYLAAMLRPVNETGEPT